MINVCHDLFLGDDGDCFYDERKGWSVLHACKSPCYDYAKECIGPTLGGRGIEGIIYHKGHMFLDLLDRMDMYDDLETGPMLRKAMDFIEKEIKNGKVLVHCNVCVSRSPSIVMLYLAKRANSISNKSFRAAAKEFYGYYEYYFPSRGLEQYLRRYWNNIE